MLRKSYTFNAGIRDPEGRNVERAAKVRAYASGTNREAIAVDVDVLNETDCLKAVEAILAWDGKIDAAFQRGR
jgi:hypothetical protein